jgi:hypothetical protein
MMTVVLPVGHAAMAALFDGVVGKTTGQRCCVGHMT